MKSISMIAEAINAQHALELLETQSINALHAYFEKIYSESASSKSKAAKNLAQDLNFKSAYILTKELFENNIEHPKIEELKKIVKKETQGDLKGIIFTQFRDSASKILKELSESGIKSKLFVGQAKKKDTGLSQKEQKKIIEEFRNNEFNVLIATSVAEEGLDIPKVDFVLFYEPIPSAIRHIQRRGRTGRLVKGKVIILVTKNTRDEAYRWSSFNKEKKMYANLKELKNKPLFARNEEQKLDKFISEQEVKVFVDYREKSSGIAKELLELGIKVDMQKLEVGDYILSSRCGIEIKKVPDFVDSIIDGRLLQQIRDLKHNFERPLLIIEGEENIYSARNIHANAIRGMLSTIIVSYGIPILQTKNFKETAALIAVIAKREQEETTSYFNPHGEKKPLTVKEQQEYIVSAFPNIGTTLAKPILQKFKTIKDFCSASENDLKEIDLIGPKKAKAIKEILETEYK
jgi:Fanconi anemia group M protein